ncbi:MAG: hypothetical protein QOH21_2392, partial [Acidobacteriota bacterium]|nr:hypothetical protein [Acidobacteriota bacterium]
MIRAAVALLIALSAATAHAERLYLSNERAGTIQVIDSATDRIAGTANVGNRPRGLA